MAEPHKQEIKGDKRDIGVVGKGTRDDKDFQTISIYNVKSPRQEADDDTEAN